MDDSAIIELDAFRLRKAVNYASRLLKIRLRSEKELLVRLKQKKFSSAVVNFTLRSLKKSGYLNDAFFAKRWVSQRINKPLGFRRLRFELTEKGVDKKIIDSVLSEAGKNYSEYDVILDLVRTKFKKIISRKIEYKQRRKMEGFLLRRGFSADVVADVIGGL